MLVLQLPLLVEPAVEVSAVQGYVLVVARPAARRGRDAVRTCRVIFQRAVDFALFVIVEVLVLFLVKVSI